MNRNDYSGDQKIPTFRSNLSESEIKENFAGVDMAAFLMLGLEEALRYERGESANVTVVQVAAENGTTMRTVLMDYMEEQSIREKVDKLMLRQDGYKLIWDHDEGGFVIYYPKLRGCISCGDTIEEAVKNGDDARREWFWAMIEDGREAEIPQIN